MPEKRPSENTSSYWLSCQNRTDNKQPPVKRHNGKWLIFCDLKEVDAHWAGIKAATEAGMLGHYACVSTRKFDTEPKGGHIYRQKVICVMTYDDRDYEDVVRVREALRAIGYEKILGYKTWRATRERRFAHLGHRQICKYRM